VIRKKEKSDEKEINLSPTLQKKIKKSPGKNDGKKTEFLEKKVEIPKEDSKNNENINEKTQTNKCKNILKFSYD